MPSCCARLRRSCCLLYHRLAVIPWRLQARVRDLPQCLARPHLVPGCPILPQFSPRKMLWASACSALAFWIPDMARLQQLQQANLQPAAAPPAMMQQQQPMQPQQQQPPMQQQQGWQQPGPPPQQRWAGQTPQQPQQQQQPMYRTQPPPPPSGGWR